MSNVTIKDLQKTFGDYRAVRGATVEIAEGEFVTLLGESGCGKTTTLRCIAGLETPTSGHIGIGGTPVFDAAQRIDLPPEQRHLGMVFQSYALWPHMTVLDNVAYSLRTRGTRTRAAREQAHEMLRVVGLDHLAARHATSVSGGQQQRIALARALVSKPRVVLYDEPLSNLDPSLRRQMRDEIRRLHRLDGATSVYVTHDLEESMHLSDRVIVMQAGVFEQIGTPSEVYRRPATEFVARFVGFDNLLPVTVREVRADSAVVAIEGADSPLTVSSPAATLTAGEAATVAVRAVNLRLLAPDESTGSTLTSIPGTVIDTTYLGGRIEVKVRAGGRELRVGVSETDLVDGRLVARVGDHVRVGIRGDLCAAIPAGEGSGR